MQRPRRQIEGPRVQQQEAALPRRNGRQLREADVVADGHRDLAVRRDVHQRELVARRQHVRLAEGDLARDVDVEEVHLAVRREQRPVRREEQRRVVVLLARRRVLRDAAAEDVGARFGREGGERVEGRGLRLRGGGREERLGVGGEELAAVGRVEAFREDDQGGAGAGGFEDFGAGAGEVGGFVGAWGVVSEGRGGMGEWEGVTGCELHKSELEGFFEEAGHFCEGFRMYTEVGSFVLTCARRYVRSFTVFSVIRLLLVDNESSMRKSIRITL